MKTYEPAPTLPRRWTLTAALLAPALMLAACGGAAELPATHPQTPDSESEAEPATGSREVVEAKLAEARAALETGAPRKARFAAEEARRAAGQADLREVLAVIDEIDAHEAREIAAEVRQLAAGRQCQNALETVSAILKRTPPPGRVLVDTLQNETEAALVACLRVDLDEAIDQGDFARARSILEVPSVTVGLREKAWKALVGTVQAAVAKSVADGVRADIAAGKYEDAARKLEAARQTGAVSGKGDGVVAQFREVFTGPLLAKIEGVLDKGKGDAQATLAEVDSISKLLDWELPSELATARRALSIWAECKRLHCTVSKPERRWTYGGTTLSPSETASGSPIKTLTNAQQVFVVAKAGAFSLVTLDSSPSDASLRQRLLDAAGWAPSDRLKAETTTDWLLPGNELVGSRVFGPLRQADKNYYLGVVSSVEGDRVTVKRFSDEELVTVSRSTLRSGRMASGTKVLAYCTNPLKMEPAIVEREIPQSAGMPLVRIACPDGPTRDEVPGAIVSKAEWLPRPRP